MTQPRYVSTARLATALGVGVSTVKRWVDDGKLPAHKTPGGHRKVLLDEVLQLIRSGELPCTDLAAILDEVREAMMAPVPLAERLFDVLCQGNREVARSLLLNAFQSGMLIETLADEVLSPVLRRIGHHWEEGDVEVHQEHWASQICLGALQEIRGQLTTDPHGPIALGCGPEHDMYAISGVLIEIMLVQQGWRVINLGPHTPMLSVEKALKQHNPRLIWVSVNHLDNPEQFLKEYTKMQHFAVRRNASIAVGGHALSPAILKRMSYSFHASGLTPFSNHAANLLRGDDAD